MKTLEIEIQLSKLEEGRYGFCMEQDRNREFHLEISKAVSYTHLRAHETPEHLVCRLLLEKKKKKNNQHNLRHTYDPKLQNTHQIQH